MKKYAIVGIGLADGLGIKYKENFEKYLNGETSPDVLSNFNYNDYPVIKARICSEVDSTLISLVEYLEKSELKVLDRYGLLGMYSAIQAIEEAKIKTSQNTGVIFSSLGGATPSTFNCMLNLLENKRISPRQALATQRDNISGLISRKFGFYGVNVGLNSACSSGLVALDYACRLLEDDTYEQMVVGACDVMADPMNLYMFQQIGALDLRPDAKSSPFNKIRHGFIMGEGSAAFVVKKLENAIKNNDAIHAIISGIGFCNESYHETSMNGVGAKISIDMALKRAGINKEKIDLINAHATSTPNGDEIEYEILKEYFPNKPVQALKANIGHTMAACSIIESIYAIEAMKQQKIGPVANLTDPIGDSLFLPKLITSQTINYVLKNSFGFGGKSAAIIYERFQG